MIEPILSWCGRHNYTARFNGKNAKTILLGEIHRNKSHRVAQEELIDRLKPEYLIHEHAGPLMYDPNSGKWTIQKGVKMNGADRQNTELYQERFLEEWAKKYNCVIVGNDHSQTETELFITGGAGWETMENDASELRMGKRIAEYASKTRTPLIAINGSDHVSEDSMIHEALRKARVSYIVIDQTEN